MLQQGASASVGLGIWTLVQINNPALYWMLAVLFWKKKKLSIIFGLFWASLSIWNLFQVLFLNEFQ